MCTSTSYLAPLRAVNVTGVAAREAAVRGRPGMKSQRRAMASEESKWM
jgi:hypothetical protein